MFHKCLTRKAKHLSFPSASFTMASLKQVALALLAVSSFAAASPYDKRSVLANRATCNIQKRRMLFTACSSVCLTNVLIDASHKSAHAKKPRKSMMPGQSMSNLGTLSNPPLPKYLGPAGPDGLPPWGNRTVNNTNPYEDTPDTGVTRYYQFHIENITVAPDGVPTEGLVVNGQYPGPMIEANWGDWIEVNVMNHLDEGTTMHWHGMLQKESQWFDGVPGVQQCPISPGVNQSLTYRFRADLYGTTWYHSHYSAQYSSGLTGPMVVYGPKNIEDDIDLGPVFVQDWYHQTYQELLEYVIGQNVSTYEPPPYAPPNPPGVPFGAQDPNLSNNLINGRNYFPCNNTYCEPDHAITKFRFQSGKNMRLRLINAGSEAGQQFSIDNHNFSVVTNDMVPIQPFEASSITLSVGQRADIIVPAIGKPTDAVFMRSAACSTDPGNSPQAVAAIYYEHADTHKLPTTNNPEFQQCGVPDLESGTGFPWYPIAPGEPTTTIVINITAASNGTNLLWTMNNSTYHADFDLPTLLGAKIGMDNFAPNQ